ncbi:MAG: PAS domain-containing protein [Candidatus Aminicenantes bacterium]|nr:MAG: PAS domain-containing protein [Candidatus Aminicenantes bacterium]
MRGRDANKNRTPRCYRGVTFDTGDHLGGGWLRVLDQLDEAVIVLDHQRILQHVNQAARRLLGYEQGQPVGGRCRLTTRGVDCENACPLTFALETGLETVRNFTTVYHSIDGRALHLDVTVIPLADAAGEFCGAVEILRPNQPRPGFYTCGQSETALALQRRAAELAGRDCDLIVVGDRPSCLDVARTIHRFSGLPDGLFSVWGGAWDDPTPWPPGTMYAYGHGVYSEVAEHRPEGWRIVVGMSTLNDEPDGSEIWDLPPLDDLSADLPRMIGAWVEEMAPGKSISAAALEQLVLMAGGNGLEEVERTLATALAAASDRVDLEHLPVDGYRTVLVEELMKTGNPLAALEERVLREVVERCGWRMQEAAERLGISRVTLWRKMKDLGIEKSS